MNVPPLTSKEPEAEPDERTSPKGASSIGPCGSFLGDSAAERALDTTLIKLNGERYMSLLNPNSLLARDCVPGVYLMRLYVGYPFPLTYFNEKIKINEQALDH